MIFDIFVNLKFDFESRRLQIRIWTKYFCDTNTQRQRKTTLFSGKRFVNDDPSYCTMCSLYYFLNILSMMKYFSGKNVVFALGYQYHKLF